jgi:hypothetical protein
MEHHTDFYLFITHFWWLIFPIMWAVGGMTRALLRHSRANRTLDIVKSYVDQGKDVPPELLAALQDRGRWGPGRQRWRHDHDHGWMAFFLFAGLAAGFAAMAWMRMDADGNRGVSFIFLAIVMTGLALGSLVRALTRRQTVLPPPDGQP